MCIIVDAFAYSRKATITFVMSVRLSVSPHTGFSEIRYLRFLLKSVEELTFFYNQTTLSEILHYDLSTVYCCQRIKIAIKVLPSIEIVPGC